MDFKNKVLVTTALDTSWGELNQKIIFLGEWCKRFSKRNLWSHLDYETIDFHWRDRQKLENDHQYLEDLNEELLENLAIFLNDFHKLNKSKEYWRVVIGPWLLVYIPVIWDRWEAITSVMNLNEEMDTYFINNALFRKPPNDITQFREDHDSDIWNHSVFAQIIKKRHPKNIHIKKIKASLPKASIVNENTLTNKQKILQFSARILDSILKIFSNGKQEIIFFHSYFPRKDLLYFYFKLRVLPRWHSLLKEPVKLIDSKDRINLELKTVQGKNDFEEFLIENILNDIPVAYLEGLDSIREKIKNIVTAKKIFTANAYIGNETFKVWAAEQISLGSKLIISSHGGAFYPKFNNFDVEEKIAHERVVWGKEWIQSQTRLPPNKLHYKSDGYEQKKKILFIDFENTRYGFRCQSVPVGPLVLDVFNQNKKFLMGLNAKILRNLKIRPKGLGSWETEKRYIHYFGKDIITDKPSMLQDFDDSKIVICSYPQTSLSESMFAGIPTILLLKKGIWECQSIFDELFDELEKASILHFDPIKAALHLENIYENPKLWWESKEVLFARKKFDEICLTIRENPKNMWVNFFRDI